ncbi:hypothetical protein jhhlp_007392 [Lomentospora prolificans]|uniref:Bromodomain associated domain-containing protein n=1 Tax=Lomentospora prolificans TaxID=41688 RepID=A0A2N3N2K0_9PEZI|nr:hypothetical protein jhhlp_007392 [Lomentospora prolificans]
MTSPPAFYHALLRPVVLQILRATGYYACRPAVLDTFTDLAARYLYMLAEKTAHHASDNEHAELPSVVDVRMALQDVAALLPERGITEQEYMGVEDTRGMDEFLAWFSGPRNKLIRDYAVVDGDPDATDYLSALKKKHSKTGEDSKYHSTILGKGNEQGEILIEGVEELTSIESWEKSIRGPPEESETPNGRVEEPDPGTPSSALSSVDDRIADVEMELT